MMTVWDRFLGALMGLAAGDALGTTAEFKRLGSFPPVQDMAGGGVFGLEPGEWTDDTSMALCLASSLVEMNGFDAVDQMRKYQLWYREGYLSSKDECFDIGNTVLQAIRHFEKTGKGYCGSPDPNTAGNGSIMRLAPIPLYYMDAPDLAIQYAAESSRTTHAAIECLDACRVLAALIWGALQGWPKERLIDPNAVLTLLNGHQLTPHIEEIVQGSYLGKEPPQIAGTGYVVKSLEAALWAFAKSETFEHGALLAVNLGDDADTTGAVYGQLAGAHYGYSRIPNTWLQKLAKRELIERLAGRLYKHRFQSV